MRSIVVLPVIVLLSQAAAQHLAYQPQGHVRARQYDAPPPFPTNNKTTTAGSISSFGSSVVTSSISIDIPLSTWLSSSVQLRTSSTLLGSSSVASSSSLSLPTSVIRTTIVTSLTTIQTASLTPRDTTASSVILSSLRPNTSTDATQSSWGSTQVSTASLLTLPPYSTAPFANSTASSSTFRGTGSAGTTVTSDRLSTGTASSGHTTPLSSSHRPLHNTTTLLSTVYVTRTSYHLHSSSGHILTQTSRDATASSLGPTNTNSRATSLTSGYDDPPTTPTSIELSSLFFDPSTISWALPPSSLRTPLPSPTSDPFDPSTISWALPPSSFPTPSSSLTSTFLNISTVSWAFPPSTRPTRSPSLTSNFFDPSTISWALPPSSFPASSPSDASPVVTSSSHHSRASTHRATSVPIVTLTDATQSSWAVPHSTSQSTSHNTSLLTTHSAPSSWSDPAYSASASASISASTSSFAASASASASTSTDATTFSFEPNTSTFLSAYTQTTFRTSVSTSGGSSTFEPSTGGGGYYTSPTTIPRVDRVEERDGRKEKGKEKEQIERVLEGDRRGRMWKM